MMAIEASKSKKQIQSLNIWRMTWEVLDLEKVLKLHPG